MPGNEIIAILYDVVTETGEPPSVTFTYAILAETTRIVNLLAKRAKNLKEELPNSVLDKWLYIAEEYYKLGHYLYALEYYGKAIEAIEGIENNVASDEKLQSRFISGFANMLDIFTRMGNKEAADDFLEFVKEIAPSSFEAIQKTKPVFLETDPVEYTERYISILPELEAKIEAELRGESLLSDIYCFIYWHKKEEILKRDYGIEWESPASMNPHVRFN